MPSDYGGQGPRLVPMEPSGLPSMTCSAAGNDRFVLNLTLGEGDGLGWCRIACCILAVYARILPRVRREDRGGSIDTGQHLFSLSANTGPATASSVFSCIVAFFARGPCCTLALPSRLLVSLLACILQVAGPPRNRLPRLRRELDRVTHALFVAGGILVVQGLAVFSYLSFTARDHDLPAPLPTVIGHVASLLDVDVAVYDQTVSLHSMRQIHSLGATWELLLDPVTFCFLASVVVVCAA